MDTQQEQPAITVTPSTNPTVSFTVPQEQTAETIHSDNIENPEAIPQTYTSEVIEVEPATEAKCSACGAVQSRDSDWSKHINGSCIPTVETTEQANGTKEAQPKIEEKIPVENRRPNGTFGPGNNANPFGRPKRDWTWKDLLEDVAEEEAELRNKLGVVTARQQFKKLIAKKLFKMAVGGDMQAIKEIMNRMDGPASSLLDPDEPQEPGKYKWRNPSEQ